MSLSDDVLWKIFSTLLGVFVLAAIVGFLASLYSRNEKANLEIISAVRLDQSVRRVLGNMEEVTLEKRVIFHGDNDRKLYRVLAAKELEVHCEDIGW